MAMTQRAVTLNIQPITAPCLRHSATGQPVTIFASRLNVILRRVVYHRDGNFPGESGEFRGTPKPFRTVRAMPKERRTRSRCCRRGHSVERSRPPSRRLPGTGPPDQNNPGQYNPGHHPVQRRSRRRPERRRRDQRRAASRRLSRRDGAAARRLLQDRQDIVAGFPVRQVII